ncbi:MAG: hypothetical protein HY904_19200 [Deltaproteobacteria bacterium]|nr:hypothetical protein [Deltaproteobacteria bacterium]
MDPKAAEERFFNSLQIWTEPCAQRKERVLDAATDVPQDVDRMFDELLRRRSLPPT